MRVEGLLQLRLRVSKSVALDPLLELNPGLGGKQRMERGAVCLHEIPGAGVKFGEQLDQLHRRFAGLSGVHCRLRCGRRGSVRRGWTRRGLQLGEQGIERSRDLLLRGLHFRSGGLGANEFLQSVRGGLNGFGTDVAGHTFERVRETLGKGNVALSQRGGNLSDRRALLLDELTE